MPPSPNGSNGRGPGGRFTKGNPGGPGNPHARQAAKLRSVLLSAVSEDDLRSIAAKLVERAKSGDLAAAREVLNRCIGKPDYAKDPDALDLHAAQLEADRLEAERLQRQRSYGPIDDVLDRL